MRVLGGQYGTRLWTILGDVINYFFPNQCLGCYALNDDLICEHCSSTLKIEKKKLELKGFDQVIVLTDYKFLIRKILTKVKFNGWDQLARQFSSQCLSSLSAPFEDIDYAILVPLHKSRHRWRGFNQLDPLFSERLSSWGWPVLTAVRRIKKTPPLFQLDFEERRRVLAECFAVIDNDAAKIKGKRVVVVDDILTTGASLEALAEVLRPLGPEAIYGLCLAEAGEK